jgi:hypothetical protein
MGIDLDRPGLPIYHPRMKRSRIGRHGRHCAWLGVALACASTRPVARPEPPGHTPIPLSEAHEYFAEAAALCAADHGATWGVSLCGPMMVVDRETRFMVANQADAGGQLRAQAGVFVGTLPPDENIANTSFHWSGVHWVQMGWPLPADRAARDVLMMHELFHRIADQVRVPESGNGDNWQLDIAEGRYYMQLEWRALAGALRATTDDERRTAIAAALAFRDARRKAFPSRAATEDALELHEGLAEYTGVVVGRPEAAARIEAALGDLGAHVHDQSFVRSFAYATGPSYGLLLDRYAPRWRAGIASLRSLSDALAAAIPGPLPDADAAAVAYDGPALHAAEQARAAQHAAQLAQYRRVLVDGPVATLRFRKMKIQFDPRTIQPLGELGSVYPSLRVVDDWGVLEVTGGALLKADWSAVVVPAPSSTAQRPISGDGWRLTLAPGWRLEPDERAGDVRLAPP